MTMCNLDRYEAVVELKKAFASLSSKMIESIDSQRKTREFIIDKAIEVSKANSSFSLSEAINFISEYYYTGSLGR